ncbi:hypothetical protein FCIRC_1738 [Fusarium circinatum]|uniref:Uncharacterized protein n=1 Tax=Fusarium circinatum TaxID=48490 RepID=A0A8H5XB66_FUSCI|nr:hypothetical protein FCIRC_1738 [Fusarium circinatum]
MKYRATDVPALPHNASPRFLYVLRLIVRVEIAGGAGAKMVVCEHNSMHTNLDGFKKCSRDPEHIYEIAIRERAGVRGAHAATHGPLEQGGFSLPHEADDEALHHEEFDQEHHDH